MLSEAERAALLQDKQYFIENGAQASYFEWLRSKGTNFTCYEQYMDSLTEQDILNLKIEKIRIIIYALQRPITIMYFYWTMLVFIIHKFNFKKPIMRLILYHYVLRSAGNVLDKLGDLLKYYYTNENLYEGTVLLKSRCKTTEMHPLKWLLTRQICNVLWYVGEIIGDWYPLLRTHAIVKKNKAIWAVYITCGIFNLSKISLMILHLSYSAGSLYNKDGAYDNIKSSKFYEKYYNIQLAIIYTSFFYDVAVYIVLKRCIFHKEQYNQGFLKKFKNLSEYRMLVSALVSAIFLPIISFTILAKYYYQKEKNFYALDFSFEETRMMVTNVQYYMIFIDQILLVCFKEESSKNSKSNGSNLNSNSNSHSNTYLNNSESLNSKTKLQLSSINSLSHSSTIKSDTNNLNEFQFN
eukprot:jgi/Orpsp1_1/1174695/evm.model.c7180000051016.1